MMEWCYHIFISIVSNIIFSVFVSRGFVYLSNPLIKSLRKAHSLDKLDTHRGAECLKERTRNLG